MRLADARASCSPAINGSGQPACLAAQANTAMQAPSARSLLLRKFNQIILYVAITSRKNPL